MEGKRSEIEKMIQVKKTIKALKIAAKVFWWGATVVVALLIVSIIGAKIRGEVPYFCGYSVMNIISDSMEDRIPTGTYILIKKTDPAKIEKGNIICFYSDDPDIKGYPNTHMVVEDPIYTENGIEFVTKGTSNPENDKYTAKGDKLYAFAFGLYIPFGTQKNALTCPCGFCLCFVSGYPYFPQGR